MMLYSRLPTFASYLFRRFSLRSLGAQDAYIVARIAPTSPFAPEAGTGVGPRTDGEGISAIVKRSIITDSLRAALFVGALHALLFHSPLCYRARTLIRVCA
jgi:hypothetical protein